MLDYIGTSTVKKAISIRLCCSVVGISEACYHYQPKLNEENDEIADWLIRQFLPKSMPLDNFCDDVVRAIEDNLNNRPRKILGYQTPLEVKSRFGRVALQN